MGAARKTHPRFVAGLVDTAKADRLPELFSGAGIADALYQQRRGGISTVALRQRDLTHDQLQRVLRYRLVNRILYGHLDAQLVADRRAESEWWFEGEDRDVHLLAGSVETGELLAYMVLSFLGGARPGMSLRTVDRPRFVVEEVFGAGVFLGVAGIAGVPLTRLAEIRRFTRTQWLPPLGQMAIRAPVEVCVCLAHLMCDVLSSELTALVGDVEGRKAQRNLDFFAFPTSALTDARPVARDVAFPVSSRDWYPIVMLTSDFPSIAARVREIEGALSLPGMQAAAALADLAAARGDKHCR